MHSKEWKPIACRHGMLHRSKLEENNRRHSLPGEVCLHLWPLPPAAWQRPNPRSPPPHLPSPAPPHSPMQRHLLSRPLPQPPPYPRTCWGPAHQRRLPRHPHCRQYRSLRAPQSSPVHPLTFPVPAHCHPDLCWAIWVPRACGYCRRACLLCGFSAPQMRGKRALFLEFTILRSQEDKSFFLSSKWRFQNCLFSKHFKNSLKPSKMATVH